jgi:biotin carboxyl carrier protein
MQDDTIRKYAKLMKETGFTGLEITEDGETVRFEMNQAPQVSAETPARGAEQKITSAQLENIEALEGALSEVAGGLPQSITSKSVGIFRALDSKGKAVKIEVGAEVEPGDVLGSVEALGKKRNVVSEFSGKVSETLARDGDVVDYGRPLYRLFTK